ncbi:MAG: hypothetical protein WCK22_05710 [Methylophilaceae bacterium]|jgi:hypothetical protein
MTKNKSTGPVTAEGKKVVAKNATKHGLTSVDPSTLPQSEQTEFQSALEAFQDEYEPQTATEMIMVERVAMLFQKMKRLQRIENTLFEVAKKDASTDEMVFKSLGIKEKNELIIASLTRMLKKYDTDEKTYPDEIIAELQSVSRSTSYEPNDFIKDFPHCYQLALKYADDNKMPIQDYLLSSYNPDRYSNEIFQRNKKNASAYVSTHNPSEIFPSMIECFLKDLNTKYQNEKKLERAIEDFPAQKELLMNKAMPSDKDMEKLMRYQTTIERQFSKALSDLIVLIDRRKS